MKEFSLPKPSLEKNRELYGIIKNNNSVCISIRRGDFISDKKIRKTHYVCDIDYFNKAINIMKLQIKNPVFILFSDDVEWARKNIKIQNCDIFSESGNDPVWEKLRMMYNCKHFILSNSSFSWWAQYLSENKNKIVISPRKWFKNDFNSKLIDDSFIKI